MEIGGWVLTIEVSTHGDVGEQAIFGKARQGAVYTSYFTELLSFIDVPWPPIWCVTMGTECSERGLCMQHGLSVFHLCLASDISFHLLIFSVVLSSCSTSLWKTCSQRIDSLLEELKSGKCQLLMSPNPLWLSSPVWLQDIVAMCGHDLDAALFLPSDVCSSTWDCYPKHRPCTQQWVGKCK